MSERKVIVGLPVYNGQKFLGAAIESHLSQSFGDFDLVISDNGSTDATQAICTDYASKDKRVKYLRSPENRGILWNHRRVLEAIENPNQYFRWAGADDIMGPGLLQSMVAILDSRPEVEAVMPDTKNIDDRGEIIGSMARTLDLQSTDVYERAHDILTARYQHVVAYGLLRASTLQLMRTAKLHRLGSGLYLGTGSSRPGRAASGTGSTQAFSPRLDIARKDRKGNEEVGGTQRQGRHEFPALDLGL
jgi:glycosyltransferase involved in cell wall biosynthesis